MHAAEIDAFLKALLDAGWNVARKSTPLSISPAVSDRYPNLPDDYRQFLQAFTRCANTPDNAWFLSENDFNSDDIDRENSSMFRWDEYERMSLEADAGDAQEEDRIRRFWDAHLPIALAVHSDYAYLALCTAPERFGSIVYGFGPEFEGSVHKVSNSLTEFVQHFTEFVGHPDNNGPDVPREFRDFL